MESATGIVFDIRRYTNQDGPGVRTTVFLKGCELRCSWCFNPEGRDPSPTEVTKEVIEKGKDTIFEKQVIGTVYTVEALMKEILKERLLFQQSDGGVTFSGGEPLYQHRFLVQVLQRCREEGVHTTVDTNGYASTEIFEEVAPLTDLFLFDLKHGNPTKHLEGTAVSNIKILKNLKLILLAGGRVWIRIPVVPGFNYSRTDMRAIILLLKEMPPGIEQVHLIPYRGSAQKKYRLLGYPNGFESSESLRGRALVPFRRMFRRAGFKIMIGG